MILKNKKFLYSCSSDFLFYLFFWFHFICAGPNFPFSVIQLSGQINESSGDNNVVRQLWGTETHLQAADRARAFRLRAGGPQTPLCFRPLTEVLVVWKVPPEVVVRQEEHRRGFSETQQLWGHGTTAALVSP